ncbi:MAG: hypothetical protein QM296_06175 [Bacillota bacterium]|nr:hypothetical protein [Bacillota bacterium]
MTLMDTAKLSKVQIELFDQRNLIRTIKFEFDTRYSRKTLFDVLSDVRMLAFPGCPLKQQAKIRYLPAPWGRIVIFIHDVLSTAPYTARTIWQLLIDSFAAALRKKAAVLHHQLLQRYWAGYLFRPSLPFRTGSLVLNEISVLVSISKQIKELHTAKVAMG